jgi:RNA polymerase sigma-70 factor, ECF subfamily
VDQETDAELLGRLRTGDERAFVTLVRRHHAVMLRLAAGYVPSMAVAEEVVQDTWLGVLRGIGGFEGAVLGPDLAVPDPGEPGRTAGVRERRSVAIGDWIPAVDQSRFDPTGHWAVPPEHWVEEAENRIDAAKLADRLRSAIGELPVRQREVVLLRDVEGLSSEEVCGVLEISEGNQRVLLHRARSRLRQVLETDFGRS